MPGLKRGRHGIAHIPRRWRVECEQDYEALYGHDVNPALTEQIAEAFLRDGAPEREITDEGQVGRIGFVRVEPLDTKALDPAVEAVEQINNALLEGMRIPPELLAPPEIITEDIDLPIELEEETEMGENDRPTPAQFEDKRAIESIRKMVAASGEEPRHIQVVRSNLGVELRVDHRVKAIFTEEDAKRVVDLLRPPEDTLAHRITRGFEDDIISDMLSKGARVVVIIRSGRPGVPSDGKPAFRSMDLRTMHAQSHVKSELRELPTGELELEMDATPDEEDFKRSEPVTISREVDAMLKDSSWFSEEYKYLADHGAVGTTALELRRAHKIPWRKDDTEPSDDAVLQPNGTFMLDPREQGQPAVPRRPENEEQEIKDHAKEHGCPACGMGVLGFTGEVRYTKPAMFIFKCQACSIKIGVGFVDLTYGAITMTLIGEQEA
jgi:hypothetical protein